MSCATGSQVFSHHKIMEMTYRYSVLRYVHDIRTQEFLNVGVLFHAPESGLLKFRRIERTGRLSGTFPGIEPRTVLETLAGIGEDFARLARQSDKTPTEKICHAVIPKDDSSFQWTSTSGGLTSDLEKALESVYFRHLGRYERKNEKHVRRDNDVWAVLRAELIQRHVHDRIQSRKISTPLRSYQFQHTWMNHRIHAIKPLSLDGTDGNEIADKASHWVGAMRDLQRSEEQFQLHLLIGATQHPELAGSFASARDLLLECADKTHAFVHTEEDIPSLAEQIQKDVEAGEIGA